MPDQLPVRPEVAASQPYGAPHRAGVVRLNVNENPYPPTRAVQVALTNALARAVCDLNRYPDRDAMALRRALADYLASESNAPFLTPAHLWAANGSNEVMLHLYQAFAGPGRAAVTFAPTYSMYPEYARATFTRHLTAPRAPDFSLDLPAALAMIEREAPSVIVLANPNNPTGTMTDLADVETLARALWDDQGQRARGILVVDEAYAEFRDPGLPSAISLVPRHPHVAVTRTMSKAFAFAGARVGYLAGSPDLVEALRTVRLPYHLSTLTQAAALAALGCAKDLMAQVSEIRATRETMARRLSAIVRPGVGRGLEVVSSQANFLLFGRFEDRHAVWEALLERGVLIREVGPEGWLRVSVGTPKESERFLGCLEAALDAGMG
ncbi:MAG: histidinol-phosphate transaminase [Micrococcales bacterium]|nr:histidinol-phosphate transaminase [Micrococcales bacterium]